MPAARALLVVARAQKAVRGHHRLPASGAVGGHVHLTKMSVGSGLAVRDVTVRRAPGEHSKVFWIRIRTSTESRHGSTGSGAAGCAREMAHVMGTAVASVTARSQKKRPIRAVMTMPES